MGALENLVAILTQAQSGGSAATCFEYTRAHRTHQLLRGPVALGRARPSKCPRRPAADRWEPVIWAACRYADIFEQAVEQAVTAVLGGSQSSVKPRSRYSRAMAYAHPQSAPTFWFVTWMGRPCLLGTQSGNATLTMTVSRQPMISTSC